MHTVKKRERGMMAGYEEDEAHWGSGGSSHNLFWEIWFTITRLFSCQIILHSTVKLGYVDFQLVIWIWHAILIVQFCLA